MAKAKMLGAQSQKHDGLNREQRRYLAKHKRQGENYAEVIRRQKIEDASIHQEVESEVIHNGQEDAVQRFLWLSTVALNEAFGFSVKRWEAYMHALDDASEEFNNDRDANGYDVAMDHLRRRVQDITGREVERRDDYRARISREITEPVQKP